jgi:hypothetical protein
MNAGIVEIFEATEYPTAMDHAYPTCLDAAARFRLERRGLAKAAVARRCISVPEML